MADNADILLMHLSELGISAGKALFQIECCVWCMNEHNHASGSILRALEENSNSSHSVIWDESSINITSVLDSIHEDEAAEYGAEAIALILSTLKSKNGTVQRSSKKGGGYDYWLGEGKGFLFQKRARLEISGIRKETRRNSLAGRVKVKLEQVSKSDGTYPACVVVVEFCQLVAKIAWRQ